MENYISWSEIGQDLENLAVHPPPRIPRSTLLGLHETCTKQILFGFRQIVAEETAW